MNLLFALTAFSLNGTYLSEKGNNVVYTEQGSVNYENCAVEIGVKSTTRTLTVEKLKAECNHPTYWPFGMKGEVLELKLSDQGILLLPSGKVAGTFGEKGLSLSFDQDGVYLFLEAIPTPSGVHLEWSVRSYETLNFDLTAEMVNKLK